MTDIDAYKKYLKESIFSGMNAALGIKEKLDPHVDELAGSIIAAGPQKVADAISKMDPATFTEFAKKIDAKGILMITKQFAAGSVAAPTDTQPTDGAGVEQPGQPPSPDASGLDQELKDL